MGVNDLAAENGLISESEHTVKTCSDLTHAYNLEKRVSQSNDPGSLARPD